MKYFLVLLFLFGYVSVGHPQRCFGEYCPQPCPEGTYRYSTGCDYLQPEQTCENPNPQKDMRGKLCDYTACYCNPPTVRDEASKKCVELADCPGISNPTVPVAPCLPATPTDPVSPIEPVTPTAPVTLIDPVTPTVPVDTCLPATPTDPVTPTAPVTPIDAIGVTSSNPLTAGEPVLPNLPDPVTPSTCD